MLPAPALQPRPRASRPRCRRPALRPRAPARESRCRSRRRAARPPAARARSTRPARAGETFARAPVVPVTVTRYEPAVRLLRRDAQPLVGGGRRDELDAAKLRSLAGRQVGDDQRRCARSAHVRREPIPPVCLEQSRIRHRDERGRRDELVRVGSDSRGMRAFAFPARGRARLHGGSPAHRRADPRRESRARPDPRRLRLQQQPAPASPARTSGR